MTLEQGVLMKALKDYMYNVNVTFDDFRKGVVDFGIGVSTLHKITKGTPVKPKSMGIVAEKLGVDYEKETLENSNVFRVTKGVYIDFPFVEKNGGIELLKS